MCYCLKVSPHLLRLDLSAAFNTLVDFTFSAVCHSGLECVGQYLNGSLPTYLVIRLITSLTCVNLFLVCTSTILYFYVYHSSYECDQ